MVSVLAASAPASFSEVPPYQARVKSKPTATAVAPVRAHCHEGIRLCLAMSVQSLAVATPLVAKRRPWPTQKFVSNGSTLLTLRTGW